jgi:glycosyltransferase involved in cell wall biosynthesis
MANGTTSVVTTTGGSLELVVNGETEYIVEIGNAKADTMNELISDKEKCIDIGYGFKEQQQKQLATYFRYRETI